MFFDAKSYEWIYYSHTVLMNQFLHHISNTASWCQQEVQICDGMSSSPEDDISSSGEVNTSTIYDMTV